MEYDILKYAMISQILLAMLLYTPISVLAGHISKMIPSNAITFTYRKIHRYIQVNEFISKINLVIYWSLFIIILRFKLAALIVIISNPLAGIDLYILILSMVLSSIGL